MAVFALSLSSQAYADTEDLFTEPQFPKAESVKKDEKEDKQVDLEASIEAEDQARPQLRQSNIDADISQVSRLDSLTTRASEGNLELQILQQQLERRKIEAQLKEDGFQKRLENAMNSLSIRFQEKEAEYQSTIESLQNELRRQRHINDQDKASAQEVIRQSQRTENNVFVTNVIGVGINLSASVYFEDKIIDVREGMRINPTLRVNKILPNGVIFENNGEEDFVALTNEEYAFSRTFNREAATLMEGTSPNSARRTFN